MIRRFIVEAKREWLNEKEGSIEKIEDLDNPDYFPENDKIYDFNLLENIIKIVPEDMNCLLYTSRCV